MKKVLFLTPFVPSCEGAAENFTRLLLEDLSSNAYHVDLVYYKYEKEKDYKSPCDNIRILSVRKNSTLIKLKNFLSFPFIHPIFSIRFDWRLMRNLRKKVEAGEYDYVYLDHSQMFLYGHYFHNIPILMRSHDVMVQRYSRNGNRFSKWIIRKSEKKALNIDNAIVFVPSDKDRILLYRNYSIKANISREYLDVKVLDSIPERIDNRLVFMGKWSRRDNSDGLKWFLNEVYPLLDKSLSIDIIGKGLPSSLKDQMKGKNNIFYHGFVDNPYPLISNSLGAISPIFSGAGVKVKVVEALACGTPVVGNGISFEGIDVPDKAFTKYANCADDYVKAIASLNDISIDQRIDFKKKYVENYSCNSIVNHLK